MKTLRVTIGKTSTEIEADGFEGPGCKDAIDGVVRNMKGAQTVGEPEMKPEYFAATEGEQTTE